MCSEDALCICLFCPLSCSWQGDGVEITVGCFKGIQAVIKEQKGEDRVVLLETLLGKDKAMEVNIHQVKPS